VVEPGKKGGPPPKEIDEDDLTEQQIINILKAMGAGAPEPAKEEPEEPPTEPEQIEESDSITYEQSMTEPDTDGEPDEIPEL